MHDWIKRTGTEAITVAGEFIDHAQAENRLLTRVMKDVQSDQPRKETALVTQASRFVSHIENRYRTSIIMQLAGLAGPPIWNKSQTNHCGQRRFVQLGVRGQYSSSGSPLD